MATSMEEDTAVGDNSSFDLEVRQRTITVTVFLDQDQIVTFKIAGLTGLHYKLHRACKG